MVPRLSAVWTLVVWPGLAAVAAQDTGFVGPGDWAAYREALAETGGEPARSVGFSELWSDPEAYQGQRIHVEGRASRRFRQPAQGEFPALTELWIVDGAGNPFCLVFPTGDHGDLSETVGFNGTFLRHVRYQGSDGDRLAPLIVGPSPPEALAPSRSAVEFAALPDASTLEVWIAVLLALVVITILGVQHLKRRAAARPAYTGPDPEFLAPGSEPSNSVDAEPPSDPNP